MKSLILLSFLLVGASPAPTAPPASTGGGDAAEQAVPPATIRRHTLTIDGHRLATDRDYAIAMLAKLDAMAESGGSPATRAGLASQRQLALFGAGRADEAVALSRSILASRSEETEAYAGVAYAALEMKLPGLFVEAIETAAARFQTSESHKAFRARLYRYMVDAAQRQLDAAQDESGLNRLAEALLALDYLDRSEIEAVDALRSRSARLRMARGDLDGARARVAEISDPATLLELLVQRRYDALFDPAVKPEQRIATALAQSDRASADALRADPGNWKHLLARARFLRNAGRNEEALALLLPRTMDLGEVTAGGEDAVWVVNEAASALLEAGRGDEGAALLQSLLARPGPAFLVNIAINRAAFVGANGAWRQSAGYAEWLDSQASKLINPYGAMWVWTTAACGYSLSGDAKAAAPWLARIKAHGADNPRAHLRALLCSGDLDGAERFMVAELGGDDPANMLLLLQDYRLGTIGKPAEKPIRERLQKVRKRASVQAAAARVGRVISLPLSASWGEI